jgi:hypothetical protein
VHRLDSLRSRSGVPVDFLSRINVLTRCDHLSSDLPVSSAERFIRNYCARGGSYCHLPCRCALSRSRAPARIRADCRRGTGQNSLRLQGFTAARGWLRGCGHKSERRAQWVCS